MNSSTVDNSLPDETLQNALDDDELFVYLVRKYLYYTPLHT